jgi:glycosyltransferase involved in cell wall biosynthesis
LRDLKKAPEYQIVFLYREAVMFGSTYFERRLAKKKIKLVLDFDDAIWLKDVSQGNKNLAWLKRPSKTADIIRLCNLVITGNKYLADYTRTYEQNAVVIPTTLNTNDYIPKQFYSHEGKICIGWTGSITTLRHLEQARPILKLLFDKYGDRIFFRVIADREWVCEDLPVEFIKWTKEQEAEDLSRMDIGIMPLPDDEWAKGKCGFKGLQYMSLGIPAIMSPVGVNTEIIQDGENGFLAATEEEWVEKISRLIEDPGLREKIGKEGRRTVEEKYSFKAWKDRYVELFTNLLQD